MYGNTDAHVFAELNPQNCDEMTKHAGCNRIPKREVQVSGGAELSVAPDTAVLTIVIKSRKDSASEAKSSVQRRLKYVNQTLLNNGIKNCDILIVKNLSRVDGQHLYLMEVQVDATFHNDIFKCLVLHNQFIEKLDTSVQVLKPHLAHNKQRLEAVRKQTCLTALANARQKALEVCRLMGQNLGRPISVKEECIDETTPAECEQQAGIQSVEDVLSNPIDIQQRLTAMTITVKVKVSAKFELRNKTEPKKKKC